MDFEPFSRLFSREGRLFPGGAREQSPIIPLDVHETDEAYLLELEVPGLKKEALTLTVDPDGTLTVNIAAEEERAEDREAQRYKGSRSIRLPAGSARQGFEARLIDGILTVTVPKSPAAKKQIIEIQ